MARRLTLAALVLLLAVSTTGWAETPAKGTAYTGGGPSFSAPTGGDIVLWDQTGQYGYWAFPDQDFEAAFDTYDAEGADDFLVTFPNGWDINQINILGFYSPGPGPAQATSVAVYPDAGGTPAAAPICDYPLLGTFTDYGGAFLIPLPTPCSVGPGTYWVSHSARQDVVPFGQHFWVTSTSGNLNDAVWRNPGNGFGTGCTDWDSILTCFPDEDPPLVASDWIFQIVGQERAEPVPAINRVGLALLLAALMAGSFLVFRRRSA